MQYPESITTEELLNMPYAEFGGKIVIVNSYSTMHLAEKVLSEASMVGFDTETRPSFTKGIKFKTSLLQLSTEDTAFLFRIKQLKLSQKVLNILSSPDIKKIGAAVRDDIKGLQKSAGKFIPAGFIDLQSIMPEYGIHELSVRKMSAIILGQKVSKAQRLSNWEAKKLTDAQQMYAATDAWVCLKIYNKLVNNTL